MDPRDVFYGFLFGGAIFGLLLFAMSPAVALISCGVLFVGGLVTVAVMDDISEEGSTSSSPKKVSDSKSKPKNQSIKKSKEMTTKKSRECNNMPNSELSKDKKINQQM